MIRCITRTCGRDYDVLVYCKKLLEDIDSKYKNADIILELGMIYY